MIHSSHIRFVAFVFILLFYSNIYAQCTFNDPQRQQEADALVALFNANPGNSLGWDNFINGTDCDYCNLPNITCDANGSADVLDFSGTGISNIPPDFCELSNASIVFLSDNGISSLPSCLSNMTAIRSLLLDNNNLTDIPDIGNLSVLRVLSISNNQLTAFPDGLCEATSLENLSASFNSISEIPSCIGNLSSLVSIVMPFNNVEIIPESICDVPLQVLFIRNNNILFFPECFGSIPTLGAFDAASNNILCVNQALADLCDSDINVSNITFAGNPVASEFPTLSAFCNDPNALPCDAEEAMTIDSDGDGIGDNVDLCPDVFGQPGSACDDGNPNTINDVLTADCTCEGEELECTDLDIVDLSSFEVIPRFCLNATGFSINLCFNTSEELQGILRVNYFRLTDDQIGSGVSNFFPIEGVPDGNGGFRYCANIQIPGGTATTLIPVALIASVPGCELELINSEPLVVEAPDCTPPPPCTITIPEGVPDITFECGELPEVSFADFPVPPVATNCVGTIRLTSFGSPFQGCGMSASPRMYIVYEDANENGIFDADEINATSEQFVIQIPDTEPPVFVNIPDDLTLECDEEVPAIIEGIVTDCNFTFVESEETIVAEDCGETIIRQWTALDQCLNTTVAEQRITVIDTEAPVIIGLEDITIDCGTPTPPVPTLTATDNCTSNVNVIFTGSSGNFESDCPEIGVFVRTFSATDDCGNETIGQQRIFLVDVIPPAFNETLPESSILLECSDEIPAPAELTAMDQCNFLTVPVLFSESVSGDGCTVSRVITRTWTATDACGNEAVHTQTLEITPDETKPTFGEFSPFLEFRCLDEFPIPSPPDVIDNCSEVTLTFEVEEIGDLCVRNQVYTWTATDECGNSTTIQQVLENTAFDEDIIVITEPSDITIESCGLGSPIDADLIPMGGLEVMAGCFFAGEITINSGIGNLTVIDECSDILGTGIVERQLLISDECGNSIELIQLVTLEDTTPPSFDEDLPQSPETLFVCGDVIPAAATLTATDECGGDVEVMFDEIIEDVTCDDTYDVVRTWTASDPCGNIVSHTQTFTFAPDTEAPVIIGLEDVTIDCGTPTPPVPTLTATDNCTSNVNVIFTGSSGNFESDCPEIGVFVRTFSATDDCGNETIGQQRIFLVDVIPPAFNETLPESSILLECSDEIPAPAELTAMDQCNFLTVPVLFSESVSGDGCTVSRVITRTWTATDACGNEVAHTQTLTIAPDTEAPVVTFVPADITVECGENLTEEFSTPPTATDCTEITITELPEVVVAGCGASETITRSWSIEDACGNEVVVQQTIYFEDSTFPTFNEVLPTDLTLECGDEIPAALELSASDGCGVADVIFSETTSGMDCEEIIISRFWIAIDECTNIVEHSQTITIAPDNVPPVVVEPEDITLECGQGDFPNSSSLIFTDECSTFGVDELDDTFEADCGNTGVFTLPFRIVDACGNETFVDQRVTIVDTTDPIFANVPADVTIDCNSDFSVDALGMATALEDCGGAVSITFEEMMDEVDCNNIVPTTTLTRTWRATDPCGNFVEQVQTISLEGCATLTCPADVTVACDDSIDPADIGAPSGSCCENPQYTDEEISSCPTVIKRTWTCDDGTNTGAGTCEPVSLATWDLDQCFSVSGVPNSFDSYDEFLPTLSNDGNCSGVTASNFYRNEGNHSCVAGPDGNIGTCLQLQSQLDYSDDHPLAIRLDVTLDPGPGQSSCLGVLSFYEKAETLVTDEFGNTRNVDYPQKYGVRVTSNGTEIYKQIDIPTSGNWSLEQLDFSNDPDFTVTSATTFNIEILPYHLTTGHPQEVWEVDNFDITGCCKSTTMAEVLCENFITIESPEFAVNCPSDINVDCANEAGEIVTWNEPTISATCEVATTIAQVGGPASGSLLTEGTYEIAYEATDDCGNVETCSFTVTVGACPQPPACSGMIDGLSLNPQNGSPLFELTDGMVLCAADFESHDVRIRANVSGAHESLRFTISTPNGNYNNTENVETYDSRQFWATTPGTYTINAKLYSDPNLQGTLCDEFTLTFTIEDCVPACSGVINGFLLNPQNGSSLQNLTDGMVLCAADFEDSDVRIRANVSGAHESLRFTISTPNGNYNNTENVETYDSKQFWATTPGTYTINAKLYSDPNLQGTLCDEQTITFTIEDCVPACSGVINGFLLNPQNGSPLQTLTDGMVLSASDFEDSDVRIRAAVGGSHESLRFRISTPNGNYNNTENVETYDSKQFWATTPGTYTINGKLYSDPNLQGTLCDEQTITFTIEDAGSLNDGGDEAPNRAVAVESLLAEKGRGRKVDLTFRVDEILEPVGYTIERSTDGIDFETILDYTPRNSGEFEVYNDVDYNPVHGYNYYRLKVDYNNVRSTYVEAAPVYYDATINVFPNPAQNVAYVNMSELMGKAVNVKLLSISGVELISVDAAANHGELIELNLSDYRNGIYTILITPEGLRAQAEKIVITKEYSDFRGF